MSNRYLVGRLESVPEPSTLDRARGEVNSAFLLEETFANAGHAHRPLPKRPSIRRVVFPQELQSIAPPATDPCHALRLPRAGIRTESVCGPRSVEAFVAHQCQAPHLA